MTVHKQLLAVQKAMEITHHDKPPDKISRETEDSIKLDTLGHLTESPNQDIRAAAVRIVVERLFHNSDADSAWGILMRDLSGWNIERRDKALAILRYVRGNTLGMEIAYKFFFQLKTYKALVACLCGLLPDARHAETHSTYRSQPERDALWLLSTMPNDGMYDLRVNLFLL